MAREYKQVTLVLTPEQYEIFKNEQRRLSAETGISVSLSQTVTRAAMREIKRTK
ncbi:hypothetical protein ACFZAC_26170 [Pseudomonas fluorescens]|uniref:hypothetical protein n=1 Tax=Pseudomonas fluorescens TaxID=294 RepID=UPI00374948BA